MKNTTALLSTPRAFSLAKLSSLLILSTILSGCLLTSPFWNQKFSNHNSPIPLQAWTTSTTGTVTFECSQAYHGGLYPWGGPHIWTTVANVIPAQPGSLDSSSSRIYSASFYGNLPSTCWRYDSANSIWYSAVRAKQGETVYKTFDNTGLECLGRENGKAASWFGWIGKGCTETYFNSSTEIPYVIFHAES